MTEIRQGCIAHALYKGDVDIIAHVVNCSGSFNSGVAKGIRNKFPSVYTAYDAFCRQIGQDRLLGLTQFVRPTEMITAELKGLVYNLYAQQDWDRDFRNRHHDPDYTPTKQLDYGALASSLDRTVSSIYASNSYRHDNPPTIAVPWEYGSVRAGGNWAVVQELTEWAFRHIPHVYYQYNHTRHHHVR